MADPWHGLRATWDGQSLAAQGPASGAAAVVVEVHRPDGLLGAAYGPITPADAETLVSQVATCRVPTGPAVPWCVVARTASGLAAYASPQLPSGLFWAADDSGLRLTTDPLAAVSGRPVLAVDTIRRLVAGHSDPDRTPYAGVARIPPGTLATWSGAPDAPVLDGPVWPAPGRHGAQARERYLEAFDDACAALSVRGPVVLMLSAGLDSTMVAATLARIATVTGYTYRPHPQARLWLADGAVADEFPAVESLAHHLGHRLRPFSVVTEDSARPLAAARAAFVRSGVPVHNPANQSWIDTMTRLARDTGASYVLTGAHGNAAFSYDHPYAVAWALRRGQVPGLVAMARDGSGRLSLRAARSRVLRPLLRASGVGGPLQALGVGSDGSAGIRDRGDYLSWLGRRFTALPAATNPAATGGMLLADPFAAPTVLDAAAAIDPVEWRLGGGGRALARRLAVGRLPDETRLSRRRGQQGRDAWWLVRHDRDEYLDRLSALRNLPGFEAVQGPAVVERVTVWPWGTPEPPVWREQAAIDRLLALADFVEWVGTGAGRTLEE